MIKSTITLIWEHGFLSFIAVLYFKYWKFPVSKKVLYKLGILLEMKFWKETLKRIDLTDKLDPDKKLQDDLLGLIPKSGKVNILDVGAGPLTVLGKKVNHRKIEIVAIDPLANKYNKVLKRMRIEPPVKTMNITGENMDEWLELDYFHLIFARNSLDHCFDPEKVIWNMWNMVKLNGIIYLQHRIRTATLENNYGLHQWDFYEKNGDFHIKGKSSDINISSRFKDKLKTVCFLKEEGTIKWLIVKMEKMVE